MNSIFGMFMESWILRVSCKLSEALTLKETRSIHDSMNRPKNEFIAYIYILSLYLKNKNYFQLVFKAYCTGKWASQQSIKFVSIMRLWTVAKILRIINGLLWKCKYILVTPKWVLWRIAKNQIGCRMMLHFIHWLLRQKSSSVKGIQFYLKIITHYLSIYKHCWKNP